MFEDRRSSREHGELEREFELEPVCFEDLIPGDLVEISNNSKKIPADCLLVAGSVIVNESSLTGESVPVNKTALRASLQTEERIDFATQSKHILYAGTELVRVNHVEGEVAMAYVLRTGFQTVRGQMIRSMLHPKPMDIQFYRVCTAYILLFNI